MNFGDRPFLLAFVQLQAEPYSAVLAFRGFRRFEHEADRDVSPGRAAQVDDQCCQAELLGLRVIAQTCEVFVTGKSVWALRSCCCRMPPHSVKTDRDVEFADVQAIKYAAERRARRSTRRGWQGSLEVESGAPPRATVGCHGGPPPAAMVGRVVP